MYAFIQKITPQEESGKYFRIQVFPPIWGENGGLLSMQMLVILDPLFTCPGSAPIASVKEGEFRDWTKPRAK